MTENSIVAQRIRYVAEALLERPEFRARAEAVAKELGAASISQLGSQFHSEHSPPKELESKFPGLGQWIAARQFAIFEILYYIGEPSLPLLRRVAHGEYDWTQGNAIEILCRFAADGIERESIIEEIRTLLPDLRYEAIMYAAGPLMNQAKSNPEIAAIVERFITVPEFAEVHAELSEE